jgi:hypothetical protein
MKQLFKNIFYLFMILGLLSACQNVKDGLTGKKSSNSDEFLVQKKNPLVLPPDSEELPVPEKLKVSDEVNEDEVDLKAILTKRSSKKKSKTSSTNSVNGSLEKSILEKIKNN